MKHWILTDTHFGHTKIHEYCNRPKDFETQILDNLSVVKSTDVLIHLGDVAFNNEKMWVEKLKSAAGCRIFLVRGNHDKHSNSWYLRHFDFICNAFELNIFGKRVAFSHEPMQDGPYNINIHGHQHNNPGHDTDDKHLLVMLEHHYKPQRLRTLLNY